jgi:hypothetical protein
MICYKLANGGQISTETATGNDLHKNYSHYLFGYLYHFWDNIDGFAERILTFT